MGDCFPFMKASKTTGIWSWQRICDLEIVFQSQIAQCQSCGSILMQDKPQTLSRKDVKNSM